jgi:hypothetical protein
MHVKVEGAGRLVGLNNGDSTDYDSYKSSSRRLFSGKLLVIIASTLETGPITLTVSSPGLPASSLAFRTTPAPGKPVVSAQVLSALEFHISGLGSLTQNPYEFISGSLYSSYEGEVSNGNERGVATAKDGKTIISYDKLDFGDYGSDTLTIPIFELESTPVAIRFYEGYPKDNESNLLGTFIYDKSTIWNVYQEETFQF